MPQWRQISCFPIARLPGVATRSTGHARWRSSHFSITYYPLHILVGSTPYISVAWPPGFPDFNSLDFFLCGHLKLLVYETSVATVENLMSRILIASTDIARTLDLFKVSDYVRNRDFAKAYK
ncbi:hypothetical protein TNCV_1269241 [Trichonephila clavipes]|nr:hypothetical protein TNCV_1269241 [Trichonephila clavipes]